MSHRPYLVKLAVSIAVLTLMRCDVVSQKASAASVNDKKPNILFILADDQSPFDLKMYNPDSILDTPVLDKLASEGMVFDGAYHMGAWAGGVCTP